MAENTRNQRNQGQNNPGGQGNRGSSEMNDERNVRDEQRVGGTGDRSSGQDRGRSRPSGSDDLEELDTESGDQAGIAGGGLDEETSRRGGDRGGSGRGGGSR
jgi:hypothetical protein